MTAQFHLRKIEKDIKKLVEKYKEQRKKDFREYSNMHLAQTINSNLGHWSGGHSVTNLLEQIDRETAACILDGRLTAEHWKEREVSLADLQKDVQEYSEKQIRPELLAVINDPRHRS